jgi:polysaccharide biosynthesis protein PslA
MDMPDVSGLSTIHLPQMVDRQIILSQPSQYECKRIFDCCLATILIVIFAIPLGLVALAIRIDSRGPVFFRQPRTGFNNEIFWIWKFRTMHHATADIDGNSLTIRNDPRLTRCGAWLRARSIDELPQLFNVITGEMSLVGPRPHPINAKAGGRFYPDVVPHYWLRHCVRPGITGWAQVNGWRGETITAHQIEQRVTYDMDYIAKQSFRFDLLIILRTVCGVWRHDSF